MLRAFLVGICALLLRIFFRKIEVVGRHHLPDEGAVLFTLNHPSALIDPLFILCLSGRPVSFLAKEPLFRMPFVSIFVKAFESLPVYRSQDGANPAKNRAMMKAASDLLARGNALALFPEGTSHDAPDLKRFRSGAARIALSARAMGEQPVRIVPAALYYETRQTFRSRAVLAFGPPVDVPTVELDDAGSTPVEAGHALTQSIEQGIRSIMPTAENAEGLILAEHAERVFSAAIRDTPSDCPQAIALQSSALASLKPALPHQGPTLGQRMKTRRRLLDAYGELIDKKPRELQDIIERIQRLEDGLEMHGLPIDAPPETPADWTKKRASQTLRLAFLLPFALIGILWHAPAYYLVRFIAFRYSSDQTDVTATVKLLSGLLLFPLSWIAVPVIAYLITDIPWFLVLMAAGPPLASLSMTFGDLQGALSHSVAVARRAKRAPLNWSPITQERASLAEAMAGLIKD